jgi:hypothetical protein
MKQLLHQRNHRKEQPSFPNEEQAEYQTIEGLN